MNEVLNESLFLLCRLHAVFFPNDKTNQDLAQALNLKLSSLFKIKTADEKIIFVYPPPLLAPPQLEEDLSF